jgi:hypothetical protein
MNGRRHVELRLELELDAEPIAGRVRLDGDASRRFDGWLELAVALEGALSGGRQTLQGAWPVPVEGRQAKDT